jgi:hypothetical protein
MMIRGWRPWLLFSLVLSAGVCAGQEGNAPDVLTGGNGNNPPAEHTITGQVVDSVTGQPIARALVQSGGTHATLTDHEGRFVLEHATAPFARKPGYFGQEGTSAADNNWLLKLTPEAILYGTVMDANLQPIQRLQVQLRRLDVRAGLPYWQDTNATVTNAEGEFRFAELPAGKYSLTTGLLIDGLADARSSLAFVPVLYPAPGSGATDSGPDNALAGVTLRAGDHVEAKLIPPEEKLYSVSGTIRGGNERGANFSVETLDHLAISPSVRFFPDGAFRLRLPVGSYRIRVTSNVNGQQSSGTREITVGPAGLEGVTIDLAALATIPVEVDYEHGNTTQPAGDPGFPNLMLNDQDPGTHAAVFPAQLQGHENTPYVPRPGDPLVIRNVPPGHYLLQANIPPPWYVASATCGNLDLMHDPLVIGEGSSACSLRVVLRDDSASLQWTVRSQENSLTVMAFPLGNLVQDVMGANNTFGSNSGPMTGTMSGLAPGRYLVIATNHHLDIPYRDPQALEKYSAWGKEVTVAANEDSEIELTLAPGEPAGEP